MRVKCVFSVYISRLKVDEYKRKKFAQAIVDWAKAGKPKNPKLPTVPSSIADPIMKKLAQLGVIKGPEEIFPNYGRLQRE